MLPVVATASRVAGEIVRYSWAMVACSLLLVPVAGMGWGYAAVALALGAYFLREAHGLRGRVRTAAALVPSGPMDAASLARLGPMRLFHASITYLSLLFAAVAVDPFLPF
jgi:protoheme IX farnesyltransferase